MRIHECACMCEYTHALVRVHAAETTCLTQCECACDDDGGGASGSVALSASSNSGATSS